MIDQKKFLCNNLYKIKLYVTSHKLLLYQLPIESRGILTSGKLKIYICNRQKEASPISIYVLQQY